MKDKNGMACRGLENQGNRQDKAREEHKRNGTEHCSKGPNTMRAGNWVSPEKKGGMFSYERILLFWIFFVVTMCFCKITGSLFLMTTGEVVMRVLFRVI